MAERGHAIRADTRSSYGATSGRLRRVLADATVREDARAIREVRTRDRRAHRPMAWSGRMSRLGAVQTARKADVDEIDERLEAAIRFTGVRQAVTVKGIRDELGIGKAEADQVLADMFGRGLIGPAARGKARAALFIPDEIDAALEAVRMDQKWAYSDARAAQFEGDPPA